MSTYSFIDVQAAFTGPPAFQFDMGFGAAIADEGITIEPTEDKNTMTTGADGTVMHSLHAAKPCTITVRCLQTSPLNAKLQAAYNTQTVNAALHGQNVIVVRQSAAGDATTCQQVAFKKMAPGGYAKEGRIMEWTFDGVFDRLLGTY